MRAEAPQAARLACIGAANWDHKLQAHDALIGASSNPVDAWPPTPGGVARNLAENLAALGAHTALASVIGNDVAGRALCEHAQQLGIDTRWTVCHPTHPTGSYTAVLDRAGDMAWGFAAMQGTLEPPPGFVSSAQAALSAQGAGVVDMNLPQAWLQALLDHAHAHQLPLAMVAVSVSKMAHLPQRLDGLSLLVLNADELAATSHEHATPHPSHQTARDAQWQALHARGLKHLLVTLGPEGAAFSSGECLNVLPAIPLTTTQVVDATGAGDAFSAAAIHALLGHGQPLASACQAGLQAAAHVLQTRRSALSTLP